jgi:Fur family ferric uptake transcriptional regulator
VAGHLTHTRPDTSPPLDVKAAVQALRERGRRLTRLKEAVLHQFEGRECAFTADELGSRLGLEGDLSPLYRCLASLEQAGILTHFYLDDGNRRYDLSDAFGCHHHHMVCARCDAIVRVDGCLLASDAESRLDAGGLLLSSHQVTLRGVCADCRTPQDGPSATTGAGA